jgi:hypothetical protein
MADTTVTPSETVDIDALIGPEGEEVTEGQLLLRSMPFLDQPPMESITIPSVEKRRRDQLRLNAIGREIVWYRQQADVYANHVATCVRGKRYAEARVAIEEIELFYKVFDVIEREDTDLIYRTRYIEKAVETYGAPADWVNRWRLRAQMI